MKILLNTMLLVIVVLALSLSVSYAQDGADILDAEGATVLGDVDEGDIPELVGLLGDEREFVRSQARNLLVEYASESVPVLTEALGKGEHAGEVLRLFSVIKDDRAVAQVSAFLVSDDPALADAAKNALVFQGDASVGRLAELMGDDAYRPSAVQTLRRMAKPSEPSMRLVRPLLGSNITAVRAEAANVLGSWRDEASIDGFKRLLKDEDASVRESAVTAYRLAEADYDAGMLLSLLGDSDAVVRREAVAMLGKTSDVRAVEPLLEIIGTTDDPRLQEDAIWALRGFDDPRVVDAATGLLGSADPNVVSTSIWALGDLGDARAVPAIMDIFKKGTLDNNGIVWSACYALEKLDADVDLSVFIPYLDSGRGSETHKYVLELFRAAGGQGDEKLISAVEDFRAEQSSAAMKSEADKTLDSLR